MSDSIRELERELARNPFDAALRRRYASALLEAGEMGDALAQWELAMNQGDASADARLGAAACAAALGDDATARTWVERARACEDFDESDARVARFGGDAPPARERLRAIAGGRSDVPPEADVISIARADVVRFADVVGMAELKKLIRLRIIEPFLRPGLFQRFKKRSGGGVLLYGPPGCGKTMIARAIATECSASFTPIGISDILNLWIGESERNLAAIFAKARSEVPAVLFFDELDALAFSRSKARSEHTRTLVNEFLNQLDGMSGSNEKVLVLAATNMPWDVDDAMKRPGRFDRQVFVPPPDAEARALMFEAKLRDVPHEAIDAAALAQRCQHFSGADIDGLIDRAKDEVLTEILEGGSERPLRQSDLAAVVEGVEPSTLEWLKTARNLVKFGGAGSAYRDVERYLRGERLY